MTPQPSEIDYRALFENLLDGLAYCQMIFDSEKRPVDFVYLEVSKNFEKLTGLKEVVGRKATEVIPGIRESNPELFEIYGRVSTTGQPESFEVYLKPLSSWYQISVYSSKVGYFSAIFQNTSGRKNLEKRLENEILAAHNLFSDLNAEKRKLDEEKAKEEAYLASIADGIIALDDSGKIVFINLAALTMLRYTVKESIEKQWDEILHAEDERGNPIQVKESAIFTTLSSTRTTTKGITNSFYYLRKDKTKFPVSRTVSPIILKNKVIGAIIIFRDITREKEIDTAKTEFVSLASHQLRTPLTGIEWTIELFSRKEKLTEEGKKYLQDIRFSAQRLSSLVKLLLDVSRIESGNIGILPEPLELVEFIDQYVREYEILLEKAKLSIIFAKHPEKLFVVTDRSLFEYLLQNLVSNAISYTPPQGKIEIVLEEKKNVVRFSVADTGIGIPQKEQGRIFKKFARASNANIIKPDGTGLGLYIASEAAKLLGGKIWFESKEGKGTIFYVELPLKSLAHAGETKLIIPEVAK